MNQCFKSLTVRILCVMSLFIFSKEGLSGEPQPNASSQQIKSATAGEALPTQELRNWKDIVEKLTYTDKSQNLARIIDGNPSSAATLTHIEGGCIKIIFKKPRKIDILGIVQFAHNPTWRLAKTLTIIADGKEALKVTLGKAPTTVVNKTVGKIQTIPFHRKCKTLEVRIDTLYPGNNKISWGGFAAIGEVVYSPITHEFISPLKQKHKSLELEIESPIDTSVTLSAFVMSKAAVYSMPLKLKKGKHIYKVNFSDLKPLSDYSLNWNPSHIVSMTIKADDASIPIVMTRLRALPNDAPDNKWYALPPFSPPTKKSGGLSWTEGMSYSSVGKFANCAYEPLLNEIVFPSWFQIFATGFNAYRWHIFTFAPLKQVKSNTGPVFSDKIEANWIMKKRIRQYNDGSKVTQICSSAAPGFLLSSNQAILLRSSGISGYVCRTGFPDADDSKFRTLPSAKLLFAPLAGIKVITSKGELPSLPKDIRFESLAEPWILLLWKLNGRPTFFGDRHVAVLLTASAGKLTFDKQLGIVLPTGIVGISTLFNGLLPEKINIPAVIKRAGLISKMLRTYPVECKELYTFAGSDLKIRNEYSYFRWGKPQWQYQAYSPVPPLYSWTAESIGKIKLPKTVNEAFLTPVGPYKWKAGNTLEYTIPYLPLRHAAFPRVPGNENLCKLLSEDILKKGTPPKHRARVDHIASSSSKVPEKRMSWNTVILGSSLLDNTVREYVLSVGRNALLRCYQPHNWLCRKELWTQRPYVVSGWFDRSSRPLMCGDPNTMCTEVSYVQYLYSKYSGDWKMAADNWHKLMDMLRYMEICNDWAAPTTSAREASRYSGLDMDSISYAGLCGLERMAEVLNHEKDRQRIAYLRLKVALTTFAKFNISLYLDPKKHYPNAHCDGFSENIPNITLFGKKPPEFVYSRPAYNYTYSGQLPEMYRSLNDVFTENYLYDYQNSFLEKWLPDWRRQEYWIVTAPAFIAARAWVNKWPNDKIKDDYTRWMKYIREESRRAHWMSTVKGEVPPPSWNAGMLAQLLAREYGIFLIDWEPAKLSSFEYDPKDKCLKIELYSEKKFQLRVHSPRSIKKIILDGALFTGAISNPEKNEFVISIPQCKGKLEIFMGDDM